jgi:GNAT superfamily N-acetyltransferase
MKIRIANREERGRVYQDLLVPSFPAAELKPLRAMEAMIQDGCYEPLVLEEKGEIIGTCFLWLGVPGWALLDYLSVDEKQRGLGAGAEMLKLLGERYADWVILAEAENPDFAPDGEMAKRRLGFYTRNGWKLAGYDSEAFGVRYKTLYLSREPVEDEVLAWEHRFIYESQFGKEKYDRYIRIPCPMGAEPLPNIPWEQ